MSGKCFFPSKLLKLAAQIIIFPFNLLLIYTFSKETVYNSLKHCFSLCLRQTCSQSFPCAGRALRNAFLSHGPYPAKDKIHLARIIRRSYVGVELVQWLLEQCVFVQCRMMAARVWQVLLELGILHSVDQRVVFEDSNTYYQFSFEECDAQGCEFRSEEEWQNGVRLLLQLVPYVHLDPITEIEITHVLCLSSSLVLQLFIFCIPQVQNELAAALARKARKSMMGSMAWDCGLKYLFSLPPALQQSGVCGLRSPDELSRLEMVQRLAKDGCRFLQNPNYRLYCGLLLHSGLLVLVIESPVK
uniref:Rap guanine nucleotide exchange factor (GEF) 5a n=1 Tax=Astyanax mexicanus TaxID=7994 RepID=A0A8B9GYY2_ASTMX